MEYDRGYTYGSPKEWIKEIKEGVKYDGEKPRMHLLPPKAILEVGKVLTFGANKYDEENWRKLEDLQNRYSSAALRHIFAHNDGSILDDDSGLSHLAHAICCLLFKLEIELEQKDKEERPREPVSSEHSTRYFSATTPFFGSETYNQERSMFNIKHNIQYDKIEHDNRRVSGEGGVHSKEEKPE